MTRNRRSGLSQLELMISLAIMAMIAVLIGNALNFNRQALDRSALLSDRTEKYLALEMLRDRIEQMPIEYMPRTAKDVLSGDAHSLSFETVMPLEGDNGQTITVEINLSPTESGSDLVAMVATMSEDAPPSETTTLLANDVTDFQITYYGRRSGQRGNSWQESWTDEVFFPELIKIEWNSNGRPAPPLTLQPARIERQSVISRSSLVPPG